MKKEVIVNDKMQKDYRYFLIEPMGKNFHSDFRPELTPKQMLRLGVFCGKYMTDTRDEFPNDWFTEAKLSPEKPNCELNYFKVKASLPLKVWQEKGWIYEEDPRGWFQWYTRYYMGRRIKNEDERQIRRWKRIKRFIGIVRKYCSKGDFSCARKARQTLLHWAYDSRKL